MKKLLLFALLSLFFSQNAIAQEKPHATSLSVMAGPGSQLQLRGSLLDGTSYNPNGGYTIGLDLARAMSGRWRLKLGLRYNSWDYVITSGRLFWPSEFSTGTYVYDPTLPHTYETKNTDKAWQYLAGISWQSKPKRWRWGTEIEIGFTDYSKSATAGQTAMRFTSGLNIDLEWALSQHFHLFTQPGGRFIAKEVIHNDFQGYNALSFQWESGVRYVF